MHLGSNLRKAFLEGTKDYSTSELHAHREYDLTDTLIHEFCKLFGRYGTPEYGCGCLAFPDFLAIKMMNKNKQKTIISYAQMWSWIGKLVVDILYQHPMDAKFSFLPKQP